MTTEQEILEKILEKKGEAPVQWIARQMKISNDYTRLICAGLDKKGLIEKLQGRDCYKVTRQNEKKPKVLKKKTKKKARQKPASSAGGPKHNSGKDNPSEELSLGQIIDQGINKGIGQIKKAICLIKVELNNRIKVK
ncbi:MAG: hypothetical protein ABIG90_01460 [bacterium]